MNPLILHFRFFLEKFHFCYAYSSYTILTTKNIGKCLNIYRPFHESGAVPLSASFGQSISAFVAKIARMSRDIFPLQLDVIIIDCAIQILKIVQILNGVAIRFVPAIAFPGSHPASHSVQQKLGIGFDAKVFDAPLSCQLNRENGGLNFAGIIGGASRHWPVAISIQKKKRKEKLSFSVSTQRTRAPFEREKAPNNNTHNEFSEPKYTPNPALA